MTTQRCICSSLVILQMDNVHRKFYHKMLVRFEEVSSAVRIQFVAT